MKKFSNMVYTPKDHTPIGEAVVLPDGSLAIRIKNPRTHKIDEITIENLVMEVIQKATAA